MEDKFVFAFPDVAAGLFQGCRPHMGVEYIRAQSRHRATSVFLCDNQLSLTDIALSIVRQAGVGVGFAVYDTNFPFVAHFASVIKKLRPELLIVCGGPSATFSAERLMDACAAIDVCVIGEGEFSLYELLDVHLAGRSFGEVPGIVYRNDSGHPIMTASRELYMHPTNRAAQLDGIASPYLDGFALPANAPQLGIYTSRGCYHACTFCSFSALGGQRLRRFTTNQVVDELAAVCDYFRFTGQEVLVPINDDYFTADAGRCLDILGAVASSRPANVRFWIDSRADCKAPDGFWRSIAQCGVAEVNFGLESASTNVLRLAKKVAGKNDPFLVKEKQFLDRFSESTRRAHEAGIRVSTSVILGLPGDSKEAADATLEYIESLPIAEYAHNRLHLYEGTELSREHTRFGLGKVQSLAGPFSETLYTYDVRTVPYRHNATQVYDFRRGALLRTVCALTGTANDHFRCDSAKLLLDFSGLSTQVQEMEKSGSVEIKLIDHFSTSETYRPLNTVHYLAMQPSGGRLIDPDIMERNSSPPVFVLPGDSIQNIEGSVIEFVEIDRITDPLPKSDRGHWRLPLASCGLMPCACPARSGEITRARAEADRCAFFDVSDSILDNFPCEQCEVRDRCARCPKMLAKFGVSYCLFQMSGQSFQVLAYVMAHLYAILDREVNWHYLPEIAPEDVIIDQDGKFIARAGERMYSKGTNGVHVADVTQTNESNALQRLDALLGTRMNER